MVINGEFVIQGCDQKRFDKFIHLEMYNSSTDKLFDAYSRSTKYDAELSLGYEVLKFNSYCKNNGIGSFLTKKFVGVNEILTLGIEVFDFLNGKTASESSYTRTYKAV